MVLMRRILSGFPGAAIVLLLPSLARAAPVGLGFDVGFGRPQPFDVSGVPCASLGVSASIPLVPAGASLIEARMTGGRDFFRSGIQEQADGGTQTLSTLTAGAEFGFPLNGPFIRAGIGAGRSSLRDARARIGGRGTGTFYHRDGSGPAYGLGVGWRFAANSLALRVHGLFDGLHNSTAYASVLSWGLSF